MDVLNLTDKQFFKRLCSHISKIYGEDDAVGIAQEILNIFNDVQSDASKKIRKDEITYWNEKDIFLITYGNSICSKTQKPLEVLYKFLMKYLKGVVNTVHILPFFPYSSDDGFAVIDYKKVNKELGDWSNIKGIADQFNLMVDLVINHISSKSKWFEQYLNNEKPGCDYFIEVQPGKELSQVVRPRNSTLSHEVDTKCGKKQVWCTFGHDQIDLNFSNSDVLLEFVDILNFYLCNGVRVIRLDAIAFLWKQLGTSCINLFQTHEVVKILRLLVERYFPGVLIITETNIPNLENIKYFGNSNEAHIVYNFSLPPLLLHALWSGNSQYLTNWSMTLPPAPVGCAYLNFTASHDGIGLRPAEGILSEQEIDDLVSGMQDFGGQVTSRSITDAGERPYEINITWFEAMKGNYEGTDNYQTDRFLCSQIIMLGLDGIPAFYINSLLASGNDYEKYKATHHKRSLNRKQWDIDELESQLFEVVLSSSKVFYELKRIIGLRVKQSAFHPNSAQYTFHLGDKIFGFWRQSMNRDQSIFAIHNITNTTQELFLSNLNLICTDNWVDLISWDIVDTSKDKYVLQPYQCLWITNNIKN